MSFSEATFITRAQNEKPKNPDTGRERRVTRGDDWLDPEFLRVTPRFLVHCRNNLTTKTAPLPAGDSELSRGSRIVARYLTARIGTPLQTATGTSFDRPRILHGPSYRSQLSHGPSRSPPPRSPLCHRRRAPGRPRRTSPSARLPTPPSLAGPAPARCTLGLAFCPAPQRPLRPGGVSAACTSQRSAVRVSKRGKWRPRGTERSCRQGAAEVDLRRQLQVGRKLPLRRARNGEGCGAGFSRSGSQARGGFTCEAILGMKQGR